MDDGRSPIVIRGPAGAGKTALARAAAADAVAADRDAKWAIGTMSAASIPFGALAHLLPPDFAPAASLVNLLAAAASALIGDRSPDKLLLVVDDAHQLDGTSAALLHHLVLGRQVAVIVTLRSHERVPDAVAALLREPTAIQVKVGELAQDDVGALLERILGGQVDVATTRRLWRQTRGNPLYLRETVLAGIEGGALVEVHGVWRWRGDFVAASGVEMAVATRLASLSSAERSVTEVLALAEPVEAEVVEEVADARALRSLEERHLVVIEAEGPHPTVRLFHPLFGQAIRSGLPTLRRRELYRALAAALAARVHETIDLLRLATWRVEAGDSLEREIGLPAARRAIGLFDYALVERLVETTSDAGAEGSMLLATAAIAQGRFEAGEQHLAAAQSSAATDDERAQAAVQRAVNLATNLGRLQPGIDLLVGAEANVEQREARDEVTAMRVWLLFCAGRLNDALREGGALVRSDLPDAAVLFGIGAVIQAMVYGGRTREALELGEAWETRASAGSTGTFYDSLGFTLARALACIFQGDLAEAEAIVLPAYERLVDGGPPWVRALFAAAIGLVACMRGDGLRATRFVREAVALQEEANTTGQLPALLGELALSLALIGDAGGAAEALEQAHAARTWQRFDEGYLAEGEVWATVACGRLSEAVETAVAAAERLGGLGLLPQQAFVLHAVTRLGAPARVADSLERLALACDGSLVRTMARHARALAHEEPAELEQASLDFERMGTILLAAEAAADAARVYRGAGRRASATRLSARARVLLDRCTVLATPALLDVGGLPLSRREREVATLAARGLSNGEIAGGLVLSTRTIENHMYRVYQKLGVHARDELAPILLPSAIHRPPPK